MKLKSSPAHRVLFCKMCLQAGRILDVLNGMHIVKCVQGSIRDLYSSPQVAEVHQQMNLISQEPGCSDTEVLDLNRQHQALDIELQSQLSIVSAGFWSCLWQRQKAYPGAFQSHCPP